MAFPPFFIQSYMLNIAIIEDHAALREIFIDRLMGDGHSVFGGSCAEDLDGYFAVNRADLLILDLNLPGESGLDIARRYRKAYPSIQIMLLTVRADAKDKIAGYESGADLYLPKPISAEELSAAVNSVKRRILQDSAQPDAAKLDILRKMLIRHNMRVRLGAAELIILKCLIEAPNHSLEYWQMLELLALELTEKNKSNLGVYIHRLNKKLSEIGIPEPAIQALWKQGYQLTESMVISE
jgi:two-component system phosphate regulon response regulator OmpR